MGLIIYDLVSKVLKTKLYTTTVFNFEIYLENIILITRISFTDKKQNKEKLIILILW